MRCSAPTPSDRDEWLAALYAGLEGSFSENRVETLVVLSQSHSGGSSKTELPKNGENGHAINRSLSKSDMIVESAIATATAAFESEASFRSLAPPPPQIEAKNARLARRTKQSSLPADGDMDATIQPSKTGYCSPCDDWSVPPSETYCTACGKFPPEHALRIDAAPLPEYGMEVRVDLCHNCSVAQGVLRHVRYLVWLYEVEGRGRAAIRMAWEEVENVIRRVASESNSDERMKNELDETFQLDGEDTTAHAGTTLQQNGLTSLTFGSPSKRASETSMEDVSLDTSVRKAEDVEKITPPPPPPPSPLSPTSSADAAYTDALLEVVQTTKFAEYRRKSSSLDVMCRTLERGGRGCASEFIESIEECAQASASSCLYGIDQDWTDDNDLEFSHPKQKIGLKKEAFKVAGDMSAALKLLYDYALPSDRSSLPSRSRHSSSHLRDNADMLAAILEFFLDLCDEGQMEAMAFFWPQLCHIHMQMLPPRDTVELIRVELMEDFLLTVATRYSVHLALDLVWGLIADLEESLTSSNCHATSRRRRFAVLRFVSELESLLFGFEGGWGGGGVSLHGMLSPSQHQSALLRDAMSLLQLHRRFGSHYLTRSVRLDMLRTEALESLGDHPSSIDVEVSVKGQIAKNAAYYSAHIMFARKLGDIAEKLRFMDVDKRSEALKLELKDVNASGKILGGDPLNRLCEAGTLFNAVHLPANEGHVFRSKERTPVLLLAELVKDSTPGLAIEDVMEHLSPVLTNGSADNIDPSKENDDSSQASVKSEDNDVANQDAVSCPQTPSTPNELQNPSTPKDSFFDSSAESLGKREY